MKLLFKLTGAFTALLSSKSVLAEYTINMTKGVTDISNDIWGLHMMVFWVCVAIGVVVFGAMFYSIIAHRKSKGAKAAHFHESTTVEFLWTGIPILILIAMAIPASK
ncbi:MAG: cytochrome c oxidase subunit II, partial [Gammaproteobacteria bacterium]|nr:cytochrome c oxidase subunit II [Gammaproteobacteria bacterium]